MAVDTRRVTRLRVAEHRGHGHNCRRSRLGVRNTGWNNSTVKKY